jgi:hypothetical protein
VAHTVSQFVARPYLQKITRAKWIGGVTQAIEYLLCKREALSINPSPTRKERKKFRNSFFIEIPRN